MAQKISLAVLLVAMSALVLAVAARVPADALVLGQLVGRFLGAPVLLFFVIQAVLYYGTRLVRGRMGHSFTTSRLNYLSLVLTLLVVVSRIAQDASQRTP